MASEENNSTERNLTERSWIDLKHYVKKQKQNYNTGPLTLYEIKVIDEMIENRFNYIDYVKLLQNRLNRSRSDINKYASQRNALFKQGQYSHIEDDQIKDMMMMKDQLKPNEKMALLSKALNRTQQSLKRRWITLNGPDYPSVIACPAVSNPEEGKGPVATL